MGGIWVVFGYLNMRRTLTCCCGALDAIGTRQMDAVPKLVSLFCMERSEHRFSYPGLRHLEMRCWSATFSLHR